MAVVGHAHAKPAAGDLLIVKAQCAGEAREFGLVWRLLQHEVDEEGEQPERDGEADHPADNGDALDQHDQQRGADGVQREMLPLGHGVRHGEDRNLATGRNIQERMSIGTAGETFGTADKIVRWTNMDQSAHSLGLRERVVALQPALARDGDILGAALSRAWPPEHAPWFEDMLRAIDEADRGRQINRVRTSGR